MRCHIKDHTLSFLSESYLELAFADGRKQNFFLLMQNSNSNTGYSKMSFKSSIICKLQRAVASHEWWMTQLVAGFYENLYM